MIQYECDHEGCLLRFPLPAVLVWIPLNSEPETKAWVKRAVFRKMILGKAIGIRTEDQGNKTEKEGRSMKEQSMKE